MRVVITGSRHWKDRRVIEERLAALKLEHGDSLEIAHGDSHGGGVDKMVLSECVVQNIKQWPFPVRSGKNGIDGNHRGAPLKRNERMVRSFMPDLVLAFRSSGKSNGTDHTVKFAQRLGIPTEIVNEHDA